MFSCAIHVFNNIDRNISNSFKTKDKLAYKSNIFQIYRIYKIYLRTKYIIIKVTKSEDLDVIRMQIIKLISLKHYIIQVLIYQYYFLTNPCN